MQFSILPRSFSGWWTLGLCIAGIIFFALFAAILGPGPDYNMTLAYILTVALAAISIAAFITGLLGIINKKERSVLVFVAMAVSLYSLVGGVTSLLGLRK